MHFILAVGIEDTGRDIQDRQSELDKIERNNAALRKAISEAKSQEAMAERAQARGYVLQTPVYLQISEPLAQPTHDEAMSGADLTGRGAETGSSAPQAEPLINILARSLVPARQEDSEP
jgi:hypothetical protein